MTKRKVTAFVVVAMLAGAIGGVIGFVWHVPGRPSTWADVRDWATALAIVLGFPALLYQLNLQRLQFAAEAKRNEDRQRAQADAIQFTWWPASQMKFSFFLGREPMTFLGIENKSGRPIRDATCRIRDRASIGVMQLASGPTPKVLRAAEPLVSEDPDVSLIGSGNLFGFVFELALADEPVPLFARFTDDAGLHWQIDGNLHLTRLEDRDW